MSVSISFGAVYDVAIANFAFDPDVLEIQVGDSIRWTNDDSFNHTTTSNSGVWDSGNLSQGASFVFQFTEAGSFDYICTIHPSMTGMITVTELGVDSESVIVENFRLNSTYPNPFNPSTKISFTTEKAVDVFVTIYSIEGTVVKDFGKWTVPRGHHILEWDGKDMNFQLLSSGVYILKMQAEDKIYTGKMLLMK